MKEEYLKQMEEYADENNIPIMNKRGINFLCKFIEQNDIRNILEIGTAIGYSASKMAMCGRNVHVISIERDQERYIEAVKNIKKLKLDKKITLVLGDANDLSINFGDEKFDLILIDAAKAQYLKFFKKFENNLADDGVFISDNMNFHGYVDAESEIKSKNLRQLITKLKKYITFLEENDKYDTKFYKVGDGLAITAKKGVF